MNWSNGTVEWRADAVIPPRLLRKDASRAGLVSFMCRYIEYEETLVMMGGPDAGYEPAPMLSLINLGFLKLVVKKHLNKRLSDTRCDEVRTALLREAGMFETVEAEAAREEASRVSERVQWRAHVTPPVLGGEDADPEGLLLFLQRYCQYVDHVKEVENSGNRSELVPMKWCVDPAYLDLMKWDHLGYGWNKDVSDDEVLTVVLKEAAIFDAVEAAKLGEKLRLSKEEVRLREVETREEAVRRVAEEPKKVSDDTGESCVGDGAAKVEFEPVSNPGTHGESHGTMGSRPISDEADSTGEIEVKDLHLEECSAALGLSCGASAASLEDNGSVAPTVLEEDGQVEMAVDVVGSVDFEEVQWELASEWWTMVMQRLCSDRDWITAKLVEPVARTGSWVIRRPPRCGFARGK